MCFNEATHISWWLSHVWCRRLDSAPSSRVRNGVAKSYSCESTQLKLLNTLLVWPYFGFLFHFQRRLRGHSLDSWRRCSWIILNILRSNSDGGLWVILSRVIRQILIILFLLGVGNLLVIILLFILLRLWIQLMQLKHLLVLCAMTIMWLHTSIIRENLASWFRRHNLPLARLHHLLAFHQTRAWTLATIIARRFMLRIY